MNIISPMHTAPNFGIRLNRHKPDTESKTDIKTADPEKRDKDAWTDGFLAGATIGTIALSAGLNLYNNSETKDIMNDLKEEYCMDDTKSWKIEDVNDDKTPEIILEKSDGAQYIYDLKGHSIGIKMDKDDDEIIEKIR